LQEAGISNGTVKIAFYAQDGYTTDLTIDTAQRDDVILAYEKDGVPLSERLRLVVPESWGYKWISQIINIELVDYNFLGTWESQGYSDNGTDMPNTPIPPPDSPSPSPSPTPSNSSNSVPSQPQSPLPTSPPIAPAPSQQPKPPAEIEQAGFLPIEFFYAMVAAIFIVIIVAALLVIKKQQQKFTLSARWFASLISLVGTRIRCRRSGTLNVFCDNG
jgi:hypothetical protein